MADEAPGIFHEEQQQLFGKFARLSAPPTGDVSSTGLGLWIVKRYAETMGGGAYCRSALGEGSTFGVRLPAWRGEGWQRSRITPPPAPGGRRRARWW